MIRNRNRAIAIGLMLSMLGVSGVSAGAGFLPRWGGERFIESGAPLLDLKIDYLPGNSRYLAMARLTPAPVTGVLLQGGVINLGNPAATSLMTVDSGDIAGLGRITTTDNGTTHLSYTKDNFLKWYNYSLGVGWDIDGLNANYDDSDSGSIGNDPVVGGFDAHNFVYNIYRSPNGGTLWNHFRTVTAQSGFILGAHFGGERNRMAIEPKTGFNCLIYSQRILETTEETRVNCADGSNFLFDVMITPDISSLVSDYSTANFLDITYNGHIVGAYVRRQTGTMYAFKVNRMTQAVEIFGLGNAPMTDFGIAGTNSSWDSYRGLVPLGDSTMANSWDMNGAFNSAQNGPVMDAAPVGIAMTYDHRLHAVYERNGNTYIAIEGGIFIDGFESGDTSAWSSSQ